MGTSWRMEEAFADGVLLCHLVQKRWKADLAGITWSNPSPAAARHNLTQVGALANSNILPCQY